MRTSWYADARRLAARALWALAACALCAITPMVLASIATATRSTDGVGWTAQISGTGEWLNAVTFYNSSHGWAVGSRGTTLGTTNGGVTWSVQGSAPTSQDLLAVAFTNQSYGWAVGAGTIFATEDGGATWIAQSSWEPEWLTGITFPDPNHGWAVGSGGTIVATTDGGATWRRQNSGTTSWVTSVEFINDYRGWALVGPNIRATTDGGATWKAQNSGAASTVFLRDIAFVNALRGWAVGSEGTILSTSDGGANWKSQNSGTTGWLYHVAFIDAYRGWAVGQNGTILATVNGGATWAAQNSGTANAAIDVCFVDASRGWVVGGAGTILTTSTGGFDELVPPSAVVALTSPSHPSPTTAYANANPAFTWTAATDAESGVIGYSYVLDQSPSTLPDASIETAEMQASFNGKPDGTWYFHVRAIDAAGNLGPTSHLAVMIHMGGVIDVTAPSARVSGPSSGWHNHDVTLRFSAEDDLAGVGVDFVEYAVDGGTWRRGGLVRIRVRSDHTNDGAHAVRYRAVDRAGNTCATKTATVRLDTAKPTPRARGNRSCRRGARVSLPYRIADPAPGCNYANVTIAFYRVPLRGRAVFVTQRRIGLRHTNRNYSYRFACALKPGYYLYLVKATDRAGNKSLVSTSSRSSVRKRISDTLRVR